ncbi:PTS sugar transporter subunit IIA [Halobacillus sp. Marseille-P3879]|uniref:PTS sugar transporter subunit IIA n=1 Tax=Halobacillus sp. Marseille-P3879 TaxID=2045014 RepID=UPI000C7B88ED|nr:PTS sugar transporter subunit IIA [Halobacillus sp. Marseille-P3879]
MNLSKVMQPEIIDLSLSATNKKEAIEALADLMSTHGYIGSKEQFVADVYERELQGKTGIGDHIAIPHGKSESVIKNAIAIGRLQGEIEWETLDGEPVKVILLFAVKKEDSNTLHIKMLSQVAGALADEAICEQLLHSNNAMAIIDAFQTEYQS